MKSLAPSPLGRFADCVDGNCQLVFNLSFCDTVGYAVPSNARTFSSASVLADAYDQIAREHFQNFTNSLDQVPCETTSSAQYSLAANCEMCSEAYKQWLCAVTIPRCVDYSSRGEHLQARNVNSPFINGSRPSAQSVDMTFSKDNQSIPYLTSSRNPFIDQRVRPGPYKELLPCKDLCYGLVQFCPASLQFACPREERGLRHSYNSSGVDENGQPKCNRPGTVWMVNGGLRRRPSTMVTGAAFFVVLFLIVAGI